MSKLFFSIFFISFPSYLSVEWLQSWLILMDLNKTLNNLSDFELLFGWSSFVAIYSYRIEYLKGFLLFKVLVFWYKWLLLKKKLMNFFFFFHSRHTMNLGLMRCSLSTFSDSWWIINKSSLNILKKKLGLTAFNKGLLWRSDIF